MAKTITFPTRGGSLAGSNMLNGGEVSKNVSLSAGTTGYYWGTVEFTPFQDGKIPSFVNVNYIETELEYRHNRTNTNLYVTRAEIRTYLSYYDMGAKTSEMAGDSYKKHTDRTVFTNNKIGGTRDFLENPYIRSEIGTTYKGSLGSTQYLRGIKNTVDWNPILISTLSLDRNVAVLDLGSQLRLSVNIYPEQVTNSVLAWTSSDNNVATVNQNGKVVAVGEGSCVIKCSTTDNPDNPPFDECTVVVSANLRLKIEDEAPVKIYFSDRNSKATEIKKIICTCSEGQKEVIYERRYT